MKVFKTYKHGLTALCRIIILLMAIAILLILLILTMPLLWVNQIQKLFLILGDMVAKIMYW